MIHYNHLLPEVSQTHLFLKNFKYFSGCFLNIINLEYALYTSSTIPLKAKRLNTTLKTIPYFRNITAIPLSLLNSSAHI